MKYFALTKLESRCVFQRLVEANPLRGALRIPDQTPDSADATPQLASRTHLLPDLGMLHGRMLVSAWENSLEDVHFRALDVLRHSVQVRRRSSWHVCFETTASVSLFRHS